MYGRESLKTRRMSYDADSEDDFGFPNQRYKYQSAVQQPPTFETFQNQHPPAINNQHQNSMINPGPSAPPASSAPELKVQPHRHPQPSAPPFPDVDKCKPSAPPATRATNMQKRCPSQSSESDSFYPSLNI